MFWLLSASDGAGGTRPGQRRAGCKFYFTTTLSISPLKNAVKINEIGEELGEIYQVSHLPSDFKKKDGYKRSIQLSREYGLYRQNYCGCVFSRRNRKEELSKLDNL